MSRTIEIASNITGTVALCTRKNEQRKVTFTPQGNGIGTATVDDDEAEILLSIPGYWKIGNATATLEEAIAADPQAAAAAADILTGKSRRKKEGKGE